MRKLLLLLSFFYTLQLLAQEGKSEEDSLGLQFSSRDLIFQEYNYTSMEQFQTYQRDFGRIPHARSGNLGLPLHSFDSISISNSAKSILGGFQPYLMTKEKQKYYKTKRPFTSLYYVNGSGKEQYFKAFHTQNLGEGMNFYFEYDRITSEGLFSQQLTNHTSFHTNYHLSSRNKRFHSTAYFIINTLEAQENGGVFKSDKPNQEANTVLLDIALRNAQNRNRSQEVGALNSFDIIPHSDSSAWFPSLSIGHEFEWNKAFRNYQDFQDGLNGFYTNTYIDSVNSNDTTYVSEISNRLFLDLFQGKIRLAARNTNYRYFQNYLIQRDLTSQFVSFSFRDSISSSALQAHVEKGFGGYYRDEITAFVKLDLHLNSGNKLSLEARHEIKRPNPLAGSERSNRFYYDKNLKNVQKSSVSARIQFTPSNFQVFVQAENYSNLLYYGRNRIIANAEEDIQWLRLRFRKKWNIGPYFKLINEVNLQEISQDSILPLPNITSFNSLYYENLFFQKALLLQVGIDFYYIGAYNGYAYDPAQASFHLRESSKKLGNIPQIDFFINMRIAKSARIFIKMENAFQAPYNKTSNRIENYPIPGKVIKYGISWRMIN